jgi:hypothetical protein
MSVTCDTNRQIPAHDTAPYPNMVKPEIHTNATSRIQIPLQGKHTASRGSVYEKYCLLWCDAVYTGTGLTAYLHGFLYDTEVVDSSCPQTSVSFCHNTDVTSQKMALLTLRFHDNDQPVNAVWGSNSCLL